MSRAGLEKDDILKVESGDEALTVVFEELWIVGDNDRLVLTQFL
jgi:hypothetical protein